MAAAVDLPFAYYPPWGGCKLGRVNYEDLGLEFTLSLSNLREDPSRTGPGTTVLEKRR